MASFDVIVQTDLFSFPATKSARLISHGNTTGVFCAFHVGISQTQIVTILSSVKYGFTAQTLFMF